MSRARVVIIEADRSQRQILSLMVRAASPVAVETFETFRDALQALSEGNLGLVICSWRDGGEVLLAERATSNDAATESPDDPHLLILTDSITRGRIAVSSLAGRVDLIPTAPLNMNALRNRILLHLEGPATLAVRLSRSGSTLQAALRTLPSLRRRLAF